MATSLLTPGPSVVVGPDGKRPRTLTIETWKKILRLQREVKAEGFKASFSCPDCQQPITMTAPHPTSPRLSCGCTTWIGR